MVVQEVTPEALRDRVFGVISSIAYAGAPLGIMAAGWVVAFSGLRGGLYALGALYIMVFYRRLAQQCPKGPEYGPSARG